MLPYTVRPSRTAETIVAKLSSVSTMSAAFFATSVPFLPIAQPMSAAFRAGASFTPSPVMAVTSFSLRNALIMRILCAGETRAYTEHVCTVCKSASSERLSSSAPVITALFSMPSRPAMAEAVAGWSPVIITGRMPARLHSETASAASGRGGSSSPMSPKKHSPLSAASSVSGQASVRFSAAARTRSASFAMSRFFALSAARISGVNVTFFPFKSTYVQRGKIASGAPFVITLYPPSVRSTTVIRRRSAVNGTSAAFTRCFCRLSQSDTAATIAVSVGSPSSFSSPSTLVHSAAADSKASLSCPFSSPAAPAQRTTVILFCVSVPVLSEQMTSQLPSVSTAGKCRMIARFAAMRRTPSAKTIVTTAGRPSGIAATARLMEIMNISSGSAFWISPIKKITAHIPSTKNPMSLPVRRSRSFNGVSGVSSSPSIAAMRPISVCMPVAVTMPTPCPAEMPVPENSMFLRSAAPHVSSHTAFALLLLGTDSPVSALSSACKCTLSKSRRSAGTTSPARIDTTSPGTSASAEMTARLPSRSTSACGAESVRSASNARSAFASCTVPTNAFARTMPKISSGSARFASPCMHETANDTADAMSRMSTIKSPNCSINFFAKLVFFPFCSRFSP